MSPFMAMASAQRDGDWTEQPSIFDAVIRPKLSMFDADLLISQYVGLNPNYIDGGPSQYERNR